MWFQPAKTILMSGAGFTKNFGGYLASEMWAAILSQPEVREDDELRKLMLQGDLNYETLYDVVQQTQNFKPKQKRDFTNAIHNAYRQMDEIISQRDRIKAAAMCQSFVSRFSGLQNQKGFFFTLNQDLCIERFFQNSSSQIEIPGLHHPRWFNGQLGLNLKPTDIVKLPEGNNLQRIKDNFWDKGTGQFMYVKLHGSYGWALQDESEVMVIGTTKARIIEKQPLLEWYLSLFKGVLNAPERNLVLVGYGFGDEHVNDIIADAIRDNGLRLYVISPKEPKEFKNYLDPTYGFVEDPKPRGDEIWKGLHGYYPAAITEFFHSNQGELPPLGKAFFHDIGLGHV